MKYNRLIIGLLLFFILADTLYSSLQHFYLPLDGDLVNAMSDPFHFKYIWNDLLGIKALTGEEVHPDPNRFMIPMIIYGYFYYVPIWLQSFSDPVTSVYLACSLFKTLIQLSISLLVAQAVSQFNKTRNSFIIALVLIVPLFQTWGYSGSIGIIDGSITYTFFYAFPLALLLLFFMSFFPMLFQKKEVKITWLKVFFLSILAVILSFSGPLIPGVVSILCPMIILKIWYNKFCQSNSQNLFPKTIDAIKQIPFKIIFVFLFICFLSIYSTYIGLAHSKYFDSISIPLHERFFKLLIGIYELFTNSIGFALILFVIVLNIVLLKRNAQKPELKSIIVISRWVLAFSVLYLLLLPFGGYRTWRPNIVRYDTFMPVTISLIFLFGLSTNQCILILKNKARIYYLLGITSVLLIFTFADKPHFHYNDCERSKLNELAVSSDSIVVLNADCTVLSWGITSNINDSELKARIIKNWRITKEEKRFYQK